MKEKDVFVDCQAQQVVIYAEKSDGSFGPVQTGSYLTKNYINDFREIVDNLNNSLTEKLKKGEISPIYYYMTIEELTIPDLAERVGFSKSAVKKHLDPKGFQKISISKLKRYANVLNIPLANLFQVIKTKEDKNWNMGYRETEDISKSVQISQTKTNNPLIVETKIVQNTK
jgi:transcriptional regulator with XRE-family HTH domain